MSSGNLMQRAFDALRAHSGPLSAAELSVHAHLPPGAVKGVLRRLRGHKVLRSAFLDGAWRYTIHPGAERPRDRRGLRRD